MCIRDSGADRAEQRGLRGGAQQAGQDLGGAVRDFTEPAAPVSYTHLRAHETPEHLVCRLLLEKKKKHKNKSR